MKTTLSLLAFVSLAGLSFGQLKYSKVKIYADSEGLQHLAELGVAVDHGTGKKNTFFISDFSSEEIATMSANGYSFEILIDDVKAYYAEHSKDAPSKNVSCSQTSGNGGFNPTVPAGHFENSSYAGFYRYQDMLDALDDMAAQYPNLISARAPIGPSGNTFLTHENRPIYYVKISDNPSTAEAEPKVLYTAVHHAREPLSMSQTIFYMWYLLENYSTSDEVKFLVDNTEMFFVPCINPDGYLENEANDPNGFGMHRKNKRNVGTTNPGVDLNRNYSYGWNTTGVSPNVNNDTYPGTSAFSEPETQAMKWMYETYGFKLASNSHTYGDLLLHPIGTTNGEFADHHDYFQDFTQYMAKYNNYVFQKSSGLYPASGDSDDYAYKVDIGVGIKDTVFAITPEVGDAFWPAQGMIVPTCLEMVHPNLVLSHLAHRFLLLSDTDPSSISSMTGNFNHDAHRLGLQSGAITVSCEPLTGIQSVSAPVSYDLSIGQIVSGSFSYVLNPSIQFGDEIKYVLNTEYGAWTHRDTITKTFGSLTLQASDDAESGTSNWSGNWGITGSEFYSPSKSFADSPTGNYSNNSTKTYEYNQTIDLTLATAAQVSFYAKWEIEPDYDYCQFQVSTNGGASWIGQCGNYTVLGNGSVGGVQPDGEPLYEAVQNDWVREEISLSDYLGQSINVRFILQSDGGLTENGFFFDDFSISYDVQDTSSNSLDEYSFDVKTIPNPANEQVIVSFSKIVSNGALKVYNQAGQLVEFQEITEQTNKLTVNTAQLPEGIYLIFVEESGAAVKPVKLVVIH